MSAPRHTPRVLFCCLIAGWGGVSLSFPDAPVEVLLEYFSRDIAKNPGNYPKRIERATLLLKEGGSRDTLQADIDTLLSHPEWRGEGECLAARRFYKQGRLEEARKLIRKNIQGNHHVVEQARLLAAVELRLRDTVKAMEAYQVAWNQTGEESDYVEWLLLHANRRPPRDLLKKGLQLYPASAAVNQAVYDAYFSAGDSIGLGQARAIAARATDTLWPLGVDWKIRHARALIALKKGNEAESELLEALDVLDGDLRLQGKNGEAYRQQIFSLLEETRSYE